MFGKKTSLMLALLAFHTTFGGESVAGPSRETFSASAPPRVQPAESFGVARGDSASMRRAERWCIADGSAALAVSMLKAMAKRNVRPRKAGTRNPAELIRELNNRMGRAPDHRAKTK